MLIFCISAINHYLIFIQRDIVRGSFSVLFRSFIFFIAVRTFVTQYETFFNIFFVVLMENVLNVTFFSPRLRNIMPDKWVFFPLRSNESVYIWSGCVWLSACWEKKIWGNGGMFCYLLKNFFFFQILRGKASEF